MPSGVRLPRRRGFRPPANLRCKLKLRTDRDGAARAGGGRAEQREGGARPGGQAGAGEALGRVLGSPQPRGARGGRARGPARLPARAPGPSAAGARQPASGKIEARPVRRRKLPRGAGQTAVGGLGASILERAAGPAPPPLCARTRSHAGEAGSGREPRAAGRSRVNVDAPGPKFRASGGRGPEAGRARTLPAGDDGKGHPSARGLLDLSPEGLPVLPKPPPAASRPDEERLPAGPSSSSIRKSFPSSPARTLHGSLSRGCILGKCSLGGIIECL